MADRVYLTGREVDPHCFSDEERFRAYRNLACHMACSDVPKPDSAEFAAWAARIALNGVEAFRIGKATGQFTYVVLSEEDSAAYGAVSDRLDAEWKASGA